MFRVTQRERADVSRHAYCMIKLSYSGPVYLSFGSKWREPKKTVRYYGMGGRKTTQPVPKNLQREPFRQPFCLRSTKITSKVIKIIVNCYTRDKKRFLEMQQSDFTKVPPLISREVALHITVYVCLVSSHHK